MSDYRYPTRRRTALKVVALLLAIAVGAAFVVSARGLVWMSPWGDALGLCGGQVIVSQGNTIKSTAAGWYEGVAYSAPDLELCSRDFRTQTWVDLSSPESFVVPLWPLAVVVAPLFFAAWWRSILPIPKGHCRKCWYDLRGVPEIDGMVRCPECGEPSP
jgi:hypothetical protein